MRRTPMPARTAPMPRFKVIDGDGAAIIPFPSRKAQRPKDTIEANHRRLVDAILEDATKPPARKPINRVSKKRARVNRERAAMADRRWPDRREGTVLCVVPGPPHLADDLHEPETRARGGGIADEENGEPVCRAHHRWIHTHPAEATALGLLVHSWDGPPPPDAA